MSGYTRVKSDCMMEKSDYKRAKSDCMMATWDCTRVTSGCTRAMSGCTKATSGYKTAMSGCTRAKSDCMKVTSGCTRVTSGYKTAMSGCTRVTWDCTRVTSENNPENLASSQGKWANSPLVTLACWAKTSHRGMATFCRARTRHRGHQKEKKMVSMHMLVSSLLRHPKRVSLVSSGVPVTAHSGVQRGSRQRIGQGPLQSRFEAVSRSRTSRSILCQEVQVDLA